MELSWIHVHENIRAKTKQNKKIIKASWLKYFIHLFEQIWPSLRHSCWPISSFCWTSDDIWSWYNGELSPNTYCSWYMSADPSYIWNCSFINRQVCTEEGTIALPRTKRMGPELWTWTGSDILSLKKTWKGWVSITSPSETVQLLF